MRTESNVKCDYYQIEYDATEHFEKEWLDEIEQKYGIRPEVTC